MTIQIIRETPTADSYTLISAHQSQTPESFFGGTPVLHFRNDSAKVLVARGQLSTLPIFTTQEDAHAPDGDPVNGDGYHDAQQVVPDIDVWVTSQYVHERLKSESPLMSSIWFLMIASRPHVQLTIDLLRDLILFNSTKSIGASIPYPAITLHAIQTPGTHDPRIFADDKGHLYADITFHKGFRG
jgi:nucleotide-sensitive chloride channel 1A